MIIHYSLYIVVMFVQVFEVYVTMVQRDCKHVTVCAGNPNELSVISVKVKLIHITYKADENI